MNDPIRIHRPSSPEPSQAGPVPEPESAQLEAGRRAAQSARDLLSQVNSLLGTFSLQDLVNQGGQ